MNCFIQLEYQQTKQCGFSSEVESVYFLFVTYILYLYLDKRAFG